MLKTVLVSLTALAYFTNISAANSPSNLHSKLYEKPLSHSQHSNLTSYRNDFAMKAQSRHSNVTTNGSAIVTSFPTSGNESFVTSDSKINLELLGPLSVLGKRLVQQKCSS